MARSQSPPVGSAPPSMAVCSTATSAVVTVVMTKVSRKKTIAFAVSTRPRVGQAVSVVRIMPVPYSEAMVITPSVITQIEPRSTPKKPRLSTGVLPSSEPDASTAIADSSPMPSSSTIMMPSVHIVERTERILVHSEASASPRVARRCGIGEA